MKSLVASIVLLTMAMGSTHAVVGYMCAMSGKVAAEGCCCDGHDDESAASSCSTIRNKPCCEPQVRNGTYLLARVASAELGAQFYVMRVPVLVAHTSSLPPSVHVFAKEARGPPPAIGPPLFVQHRRFVI